MNFLIMRKKGNVVYVVFCKKSIMLISVLQVLCTTNSSKATTRGCFLESFVEGKNKTKSVSLNVRMQRQVQSMPQGVKSSCGLCIDLAPPWPFEHHAFFWAAWPSSFIVQTAILSLASIFSLLKEDVFLFSYPNPVISSLNAYYGSMCNSCDFNL